jgi:dTDP-4-amino-4,6-dideoxygalactose transaminase
VYNQYVICTPRRDELRAHLGAAGIETAVYYPVPLHRQRCFTHLGYRPGSLPVSEQLSCESLAIPIFAGLGKARQERVIDTIVRFLRGTR